MITDYKIISVHEEDIYYRKRSLEESVKKQIDDGWQPLGAPFFCNNRWSQAMVKS